MRPLQHMLLMDFSIPRWTVWRGHYILILTDGGMYVRKPNFCKPIRCTPCNMVYKNFLRMDEVTYGRIATDCVSDRIDTRDIQITLIPPNAHVGL